MRACFALLQPLDLHHGARHNNSKKGSSAGVLQQGPKESERDAGPDAKVLRAQQRAYSEPVTPSQHYRPFEFRPAAATIP
jgi:hypothetical protein